MLTSPDKKDVEIAAVRPFVKERLSATRAAEPHDTPAEHKITNYPARQCQQDKYVQVKRQRCDNRHSGHIREDDYVPRTILPLEVAPFVLIGSLRFHVGLAHFGGRSLV